MVYARKFIVSFGPLSNICSPWFMCFTKWHNHSSVISLKIFFELMSVSVSMAYKR